MLVHFIWSLVFMMIFVPIGIVQRLCRLSRFEKQAYDMTSSWDFPLKKCATKEIKHHDSYQEQYVYTK